MNRREELIEALADALPAPVSAPVRIGIDGPDASGKTTLRHELARALHRRHRDVIEATLDDFHFPREQRYRQGRLSALGYWEDAFDRSAFIDKVLKPLDAVGDRVLRLHHHDVTTDTILDEVQAFQVGDEVTLLADGVFLQHPQLAPYWDAVIWVETPFSVRFARMVERDGAPDDPEDPLHRRYYDAQLMYRSQVAPRSHARFVIDNTEPARPYFVPVA